MIVIGCDPGLTGAICFMDRDGLAGIYDLPTMPIPEAGPKATIKREIDPVALQALIRKRVPADETAIAVIEHVTSLGDAVRGSQAKMSLAATKATIITTLRLLRIDTRRVAPATWKRFMGLSSDKDAALALARKLYPHAPLHLAKHHNRAESLLIARFALRTMT
jgi:hypothetical protein